MLPSLAGKSWILETYGERKLSPDEEVEKNRMTCLAMLAFGVSRCITAILMGRLLTKFGNKIIIHTNFFSAAVAIIIAWVVTKYSYVTRRSSNEIVGRLRGLLGSCGVFLGDTGCRSEREQLLCGRDRVFGVGRRVGGIRVRAKTVELPDVCGGVVPAEELQ